MYRLLKVLRASSQKNCSRVLSALPKEKSPTSRSLCYSLYIWQPTFMEYFISFWDMYVDIRKVHTCGSHWRLSQRCSSRLGSGKVDCAFPFLKMWKSPPLVSCDSPFLFWCVQCLVCPCGCLGIFPTWPHVFLQWNVLILQWSTWWQLAC